MKSSFWLFHRKRFAFIQRSTPSTKTFVHGSLVWSRRFVATAANTALPVAEFKKIAPMVLLQEALNQHAALDGTLFAEKRHENENHIIIARDKFDEFCRLSHVRDSAKALKDLDAAGLVLSLSGGRLVHLRPVVYVETLEAAQSRENPIAHALEPAHFLLVESERRIAELQREEVTMRKQLQPAIAKAARWRRSIWGGALCFAGAQLAIISRLTYFDLDWDIMEPVSYFVGIGTAIVFYFYFLRFDDEHTYVEFDRQYLPKKVRQYAPKDFNWTRYETICEQLLEENEVRERIREWARTS